MIGTASPTGAETELRARIGVQGPITFAEFMDVALYWPHGGYYSTTRAFGPGGDFYTAPLTHPVFGALIAQQLLRMWSALDHISPFTVVELGAGSGRLALDVAIETPKLAPRFGDTMRYVAVDRHPAPPGYDGEWVASDRVPKIQGAGVILANELLDAMPVHRVTVQDGRFRELLVGLSEDNELVEIAGDPTTPELALRLEQLGIRLPEGFRAEINLAMHDWMETVFQALDIGYLLLIDYGHVASDYYGESRSRGTLRCYHAHTLSMNPLVNVGRQDISVHVDLTSLKSAALAAGFVEMESLSQAEFLNRLGFSQFVAELRSRSTLPQPTRAGNLRLMNLLVDRDGMGAFRVLGFTKGAPGEHVLGVPYSNPGIAPLASPAHMPMGIDGPQPTMLHWNDFLT